MTIAVPASITGSEQKFVFKPLSLMTSEPSSR
jgi:hypothetical protein